MKSAKEKELDKIIADLTIQLKSEKKIDVDETIAGLAAQLNDLLINNHDVSLSYEIKIAELEYKNKVLEDALIATKRHLGNLQNRDLASSPSATHDGIPNTPLKTPLKYRI